MTIAIRCMKRKKVGRKKKPSKGHAENGTSDAIEKSLEKKKRIVAGLIDRIKKDVPDAVMGFLNNDQVLNAVSYSRIPTGITQLDLVTGGGIPAGKFCVFTGQAQCGKTSLALQIIANDQQENPDHIWVWADVENSYDPDWAKTLGVDESRLVFIETDIMEDVLQRVIDVSKTKAITGVVVDSIGALVPRAEMEEPSKRKTAEAKPRVLRHDNVAASSRKIGQFYRMSTPVMRRGNTAIVLISHVYTDINAHSKYGPKLITKGGKATEHFAHLRISFRRAYDHDKEVIVRMPDGREKKVVSGFDSVMKVEKTKQGSREGHEVYIPFTFGVGFDSRQCTINAAMINGIIEQRGAWFYYDSFPSGKIRGKQAVKDLLLSNNELYATMLNDVIAVASQDTDNGPETNEQQSAPTQDL